MASASQVGANTVFTIGRSDSVTLDNVAKTSLAASNFNFTQGGIAALHFAPKGNRTFGNRRTERAPRAAHPSRSA
jgi:hypothetical protein